MTSNLRDRVERMLHERRIASGVNLPTLRFHWSDEHDTRWTLHAFEVPIATGEIDARRARTDEDAARRALQ